MPKKITDQQRREVEMLYRGGAAFREIAARVGVSQSTVAAVIREARIALRGGHYPADVRGRVASLYREGCTVAEIMAATGVRSQQTVYRFLRDAGVALQRKPGGAKC